MTKSNAKRTVATMTVEELREFVKQIIEVERRKDCYVDDDGTLVFYTEEGYADYLRKVGKPPSKVKVVFLNEGGLKCRYSDYKLTPQEKRRLARIRKQIAEGRAVPWEQVKKKNCGSEGLKFDEAQGGDGDECSREEPEARRVGDCVGSFVRRIRRRAEGAVQKANLGRQHL